MSDADQKQPSGLSKPEKTHLTRSVIVGLIAPLVTLWMLGVIDGNSPAFFSFGVILASLLSFLVATVIPVMGETVIEDLIKVVLFSVIWFFAREYGSFGIITYGMFIGCCTGVFSNRLLGTIRRR